MGHGLAITEAFDACNAVERGCCIQPVIVCLTEQFTNSTPFARYFAHLEGPFETVTRQSFRLLTLEGRSKLLLDSCSGYSLGGPFYTVTRQSFRLFTPRDRSILLLDSRLYYSFRRIVPNCY
jgi:hypothetical protein